MFGLPSNEEKKVGRHKNYTVPSRFFSFHKRNNS